VGNGHSGKATAGSGRSHEFHQGKIKESPLKLNQIIYWDHWNLIFVIKVLLKNGGSGKSGE